MRKRERRSAVKQRPENIIKRTNLIKMPKSRLRRLCKVDQEKIVPIRRSMRKEASRSRVPSEPVKLIQDEEKAKTSVGRKKLKPDVAGSSKDKEGGAAGEKATILKAKKRKKPDDDSDYISTSKVKVRTQYEVPTTRKINLNFKEDSEGELGVDDESSATRKGKKKAK